MSSLRDILFGLDDNDDLDPVEEAILIDFLNETANGYISLNKKDPLKELMYPDLDLDELDDVDEDERRDALEEAGYDPNEFDEF